MIARLVTALKTPKHLQSKWVDSAHFVVAVHHRSNEVAYFKGINRRTIAPAISCTCIQLIPWRCIIDSEHRARTARIPVRNVLVWATEIEHTARSMNMSHTANTAVMSAKNTLEP